MAEAFMGKDPSGGRPHEGEESNRILFIHAGGGKAGSSAIQNMLHRSASWLMSRGIAYANSDHQTSDYTITSGNGFCLYEALQHANWKGVGAELIQSFMADQRLAICSSEFLGALEAAQWRMLQEECDKLGIKIKIFYIVRSVIPYLVSSYHQEVKRHGEYRSLTDYIPSALWKHFEDLKTISSILPMQDVKVVHYDTHKANLIEAFGRSDAALSPLLELTPDSVLVVNRSLHSTEIDMLRQINHKFGARYSSAVSDKMIYDDPNIKYADDIPTEMKETLGVKFRDQISWVNDTFFQDADDKVGVGEIRQPTALASPELEVRATRLAIDWALDELEALQGRTVQAIAEKLLGIDWENSAHEAIPADFDPIAYLLLNSDVLEVGVPPFLHYISSGKNERRRFKWHDFLAISQRDDSISVDQGRGLAEIATVIHKLADPAKLSARYELEGLVQAWEKCKSALQEAKELCSYRQSEIEILNTRLADAEFQKKSFESEIENMNIRLAEAESQRKSLESQVEIVNIRLVDAHSQKKSLEEVIGKYRYSSILSYILWGFWRSRRP